MIVYVENPKYSTDKLLEFKNELSKISEYSKYTKVNCIFIYHQETK